MKRNTSNIDEFLANNTLRSLKTIKAELRIKKNISLIRFLMAYFTDKVEEIDYSTNLNEYNDILGVLRFVKPYTKEELDVVDDSIKNIKSIIQQKQIQLEANEEIIDFLCKLNEKLGAFMIETHFEATNRKKKSEVFPHIDDNKLKSIVEEYVFRYKDYGHLNLLISLYPKACNVKIGGKSIIIRILKEYFVKPQDREFFSKVLMLLISKPTFDLSEEDKKIVSDLCSQYSCILNIRDLIFIKELVTTLGIRKEIKPEEQLDLLQIRFGIKRFEFADINLSYEHFPVNMTDRVAIAIDPASALLYDDAFSIAQNPDGTFELALYTIDVSPIKERSPLDIYAYNHFSTIYVKDNWIPMLPEPLIYTYSLNGGLKRTVAHIFRFTPKLKLIDCKIVPAIINIQNNISYRDTTTILKGRGELYPFLKNALDLSEAISDSLGTINKYHRIKEIVRELGGSIDEIPEKYVDTPGNRIISTFAVFLNNYLAKTFDQSGLPFIYRVNDSKSAANIQLQLRKYRHDKEVCDMLRSLKTLYKASSFSSTNTGHKGLELDAYTQATNPGRLYPSLMIQRMEYDLFIDKMPVEEYVKKYSDVEEYAKYFTAAQQRNYFLTYEYSKLCKEKNR